MSDQYEHKRRFVEGPLKSCILHATEGLVYDLKYEHDGEYEGVKAFIKNRKKPLPINVIASNEWAILGDVRKALKPHVE
jgi:hypothetical protein